MKDYVAGWRQRAREMFVPLAHPPGHDLDAWREELLALNSWTRRFG